MKDTLIDIKTIQHCLSNKGIKYDFFKQLTGILRPSRRLQQKKEHSAHA